MIALTQSVRFLSAPIGRAPAAAVAAARPTSALAATASNRFAHTSSVETANNQDRIITKKKVNIDNIPAFAQATYRRNLDVGYLVESKTSEKLRSRIHDEKLEIVKSDNLLLTMLVGVAALSFFVSSDSESQELHEALSRSNRYKLDCLTDTINLREHSGLWITAAKSTSSAGCDLLARHIPDLIHEEDVSGHTALYYAIEGRRQSNVRILTQLGGYVPGKEITISAEARRRYGIKPDAKLDMLDFARVINGVVNDSYSNSVGMTREIENFYLKESKIMNSIVQHLCKSLEKS